eukprot:704952_1
MVVEPEIHYKTIDSQAIHIGNRLKTDKLDSFNFSLLQNSLISNYIPHKDSNLLTEEKQRSLFDEDECHLNIGYEQSCTIFDTRRYNPLQRLLGTLLRYNENTLDLNMLDMRTTLNDYLHVTHHHDFQMIYNALGVCDIDECKSFSRISLDPHSADGDRAIYEQILDKIHCHFQHSFDMGYRLQKCLIESSLDHGDTKAFLQLRNQRYAQFRVDTTGFQQYSFGYKFKYNDEPGELGNEDDAISVSAKYCSLKEELTQNTLVRLTIDQFAWEEQKSILYFKTQYGQSLHLKPEHILAIMIYCNHDLLQAEFSRTYREGHVHKHCEFYHLALNLKICVHEHGTRVRNGRVRSFYHGVSKMMSFPSYINNVQIYSPLSTTSVMNVAMYFTNNEGLIVEFGDRNMGFLRYFDCGWLSNYPSERELLFIQNSYPLQMIDITIAEMETSISYHLILSAMHFIDKLMSSQQIDPDMYCHASIGHLSSKIISHRLSLTMFSLTDYATTLINTYFDNKKSIKIEMRCLKQPLYHYILDVLLSFHLLNVSHILMLFPNLEHIEVSHFDDVTLLKPFVLNILYYLNTNPECSIQCIHILCSFAVTPFIGIEDAFELEFNKDGVRVVRATTTCKELHIQRYFPFETDPIYYDLFQYFKHNQRILNFVEAIYIWNTNILNVVQYLLNDLDHRFTDSYFDILDAKDFNHLLGGKPSRTIIDFICSYARGDSDLFTPFAQILMREANRMETHNIPHILDTHPTYIKQIQRHVRFTANPIYSDLTDYLRQNPAVSKLVFTLYVWNTPLLNVIESVLGMDNRVSDPFYPNRVTELHPEPFEILLNETCGASIAKYISSQPVSEDTVWQQFEDMLVIKRDDSPTVEGVPRSLQGMPDTELYRWITYDTPEWPKASFKPYENAFIACNGSCGSLLSQFIQRCIPEAPITPMQSFKQYKDALELAFAYSECPLRILLTAQMETHSIHQLAQYEPIYIDLMHDECFVTGGVWMERMASLFSNLYRDNYIHILQAIANRSCTKSDNFWDEIRACYHSQGRFVFDPKPYWGVIQRVKQKKQYKIMQSLDKALSNFEMISIFLYCNGSLFATQMRKAYQNNQSNLCEWKYLCMYLYAAVQKIYEALHLKNEYFKDDYIERRPRHNKLFHGLKNVCMDNTTVTSLSMFVVTSFSESYGIAEGYTCGGGMILVLNDAYRAIYDGRLRAANVSWISNWRGENEWIVLPTQFTSIKEINHGNKLYSCFRRAHDTEMYEINFLSNIHRTPQQRFTMNETKQSRFIDEQSYGNIINIWIICLCNMVCLFSIMVMMFMVIEMSDGNRYVQRC